MGWKKFFGFGDKKDKEADAPADLNLASLQPGWLVDFDLKTWEVAARHHYDWGDGDISYEWQLKTHDETIYLSHESDDEEFWSISRPVAFGRLGPGIRNHILKHDDPPEEILFESTTYYLDGSSGGHYYKSGKGPGQPFIVWDYEDDSGEKFLSIEQWGEEDFEASIGESVEEYQFTNILPGEKRG